MEAIVIIISVIAIFVAFIKSRNIAKITVTDEKMQTISQYIKDGAMTYLKTQYKTILAFVVVMSIILALIPSLGWKVMLCFLAGAFLSALA